MATELSVAIEAIWEKSRDEIARRIATLEEAAAAMLAADIGDELRAHAERDAHKLAGSLGMFGFPHGSEMAREVEQALGASAAIALCDVPRLADLVLALRDEFDTRAAGGTSAEGRRLADPGLLEDRSPPERSDTGLHTGGKLPESAARTILVIDDSALIRRVVRIGLGGDQGWQVRTSASGAEGIEVASRERPA